MMTPEPVVRYNQVSEIVKWIYSGRSLRDILRIQDNYNNLKLKVKGEEEFK